VSAYLIIDDNEIDEKLNPMVQVERSIVHPKRVLHSQLQFLNKFWPIFMMMCLEMSSDGGSGALSILKRCLPAAVF
jgi:hypothetical protein